MKDIKNLINKTLNEIDIEGIIKQQVTEQMTAAIEKSISENLAWGSVRNTLNEKIKSAMIPYIENYDFSKSITKLDDVLTNIINNTCIRDNNKLLENFQSLMRPDTPKELKITDIFDEYKKYISEIIDCDGRPVSFDHDEPEYEPADVSLEITDIERPSWSNLEKKNVIFSFDESNDDEYNFVVELCRWSHDKQFTMCNLDKDSALSSLLHLNDFEIYLMKLIQSGCKITVDKEYITDEVTPMNKPEPHY